MVGVAFAIFALVWVIQRIVTWRGGDDVHSTWVALGSLLVSTWAFHALLPLPPEGRYLLSYVSTVVLFAVAGIQYVYEVIARHVICSSHLVLAVVAGISDLCLEWT